MIDESTLNKARSGLLRLLSYRQRSRQEAEQYLKRKGYGAELIALLLEEMERWNYIDDRRYAADYTESCLRRGLGPLRVRHDLLSRGVSRQIVDEEVLRRFSPEEERSLARTLLNKRAKTEEDWSDRSWIRRQAAYLLRRGFQKSVVFKVVREQDFSFDD